MDGSKQNDRKWSKNIENCSNCKIAFPHLYLFQNLMNEIDSLDQITQTENQIQFVDQAVQTDPMHLPVARSGSLFKPIARYTRQLSHSWDPFDEEHVSQRFHLSEMPSF